jgi:hypothetical protein
MKILDTLIFLYAKILRCTKLVISEKFRMQIIGYIWENFKTLKICHNHQKFQTPSIIQLPNKKLSSATHNQHFPTTQKKTNSHLCLLLCPNQTKPTSHSFKMTFVNGQLKSESGGSLMSGRDGCKWPFRIIYGLSMEEILKGNG